MIIVNCVSVGKGGEMKEMKKKRLQKKKDLIQNTFNKLQFRIKNTMSSSFQLKQQESIKSHSSTSLHFTT